MDGDGQLVARVLRGEPAAFVLLVRQYQALVYHVVSGVVSDRDAREDLCQDVFIKVHGKLSTWTGEGALKSWIARIAHTTSLNHLRASSRRKDQDSLESFEDEAGELRVAAQTDVEGEAAGDDEAARVRRAVARLPAAHREVVQLHYLQDLSVAEIAVTLGKPEGTVKNLLFRARAKLVELIDD